MSWNEDVRRGLLVVRLPKDHLQFVYLDLDVRKLFLKKKLAKILSKSGRVVHLDVASPLTSLIPADTQRVVALIIIVNPCASLQIAQN